MERRQVVAAMETMGGLCIYICICVYVYLYRSRLQVSIVGLSCRSFV